MALSRRSSNPSVTDIRVVKDGASVTVDSSPKISFTRHPDDGKLAAVRASKRNRYKNRRALREVQETHYYNAPKCGN
ncbi:hypothetical protein BHE90_004641 [Fusarium euwallaceae]|uniref:Uncharacterized protein n=2 Tax=Fusarium solani species complex TaxID=232080 RepID=A0A3M2S612_9HYPO|nr:hypothetical protein CDV36_007341 [Fusarium kuroshium]RTE80860.1 hypothetical protein BHE90_004641 [Fusarium euwallaceae]